MNKFIEYLTEAVRQKASDLHLSVGTPPACRIDGYLVNLSKLDLSVEEVEDMAAFVLNYRQNDSLNEHGEVDFAYSVPSLGRFRVNVFKQRGSTSIAARILNMDIPMPEDLGIPRGLVSMTDKRRGLVLVTGATGSGKSTTLASLINIINKKYRYHIITLEDPVEYLHRHNKSIVNQREMGMDSENYATALRAALRQDPDVILVGEMRDLETISIAVTAAETGHLVFSTLHTLGAANTIDRIIDVFPPGQQQQIRTQLADVLECVVSQQLIPRKSGNGRVAAFEVMIANSAIRNQIREAKTYQITSSMQTARKSGMQTMDDALYDLFIAGEIAEGDALHFAQDRNALHKRVL